MSLNVKLRLFYANAILGETPRVIEELASVDLTPYVINCKINKTLEYRQPFDFIVSSAEITLYENNIAVTYNDISGDSKTVYPFDEGFPLEIYFQQTLSIGTEVYPFLATIQILDGVRDGQFWGYIDYQSSYRDPVTNNFIIKLVDLFKYFYDGNNIFFNYLHLALLSGNSFTLTGILRLFNGNRSIPMVDRVGIRLNPAQSGQIEVRALMKLGDPNQADASLRIKNTDMLLELQKFYGAYVFMDGNGKLNFVNRETPPSSSGLGEFLIEDGYKRYYSEVFYDSVLCFAMIPGNIIDPGLPSGMYDVFALLKTVGDADKSDTYLIDSRSFTNSQLDKLKTLYGIIRQYDQVPERYNYLDLRPYNILRIVKSDEDNNFHFFNDEFSPDNFKYIKSLFVPTKKIAGSLYGEKLNLMASISVESEKFIITNAEIDYVDKKINFEAYYTGN